MPDWVAVLVVVALVADVAVIGALWLRLAAAEAVIDEWRAMEARNREARRALIEVESELARDPAARYGGLVQRTRERLVAIRVALR